jgi:Transcriptional regulators
MHEETRMSSFLSRITNFGEVLTPNEAKVAQYLRKNPEKAVGENIQQVAQQTGVSIASVSRLAVTLGYRDWKELRLSLAKESHAAGNPVLADITPDDSDETVVRKVFTSNIASLTETLEQLDMKKLIRVVDTIKNTNRVVFFGSGGSGCIARDESLRFAHLELSAEAYSEEFQMMLQASRMTKGQVAFGFSNSGRSKATVNVITEARKNGALTVGIANYRNTPLEREADIFFCTSFPHRSEMTVALTARLAVASIMDAIYVLSAHYGRVTKKAEYMDSILEGSLRYAAGARQAGSKGKNGRKGK